MPGKDTDHLNLLFDIGELTDLVSDSDDLKSFLQLAVDLVAKHFSAPVCSIYLYSESEDRLVLRATRGLKPEAVDKVWMQPGEGLVGQSFETLSVIREGHASKNPKFKYFEDAGEDPYNSFLCVPIKRGIVKIGVLVVQHSEPDYFDMSDDRAIRAVVMQLAGAIENARLLLELSSIKEPVQKKALSFIKGKAATKGVAAGRASVMKKKASSLLYDATLPGQVMNRQDFLKAIEKTSQELKALQSEFARRLPESASLIFTAHFMILKDKNFSGKMADLVEAGTPADEAVKKVAGKYIQIFSASPHTYMREKAQDVEDLSVRILKHLSVRKDDAVFDQDTIVIARQVYPSDILKFVSAGVKGVILTGGGVTSHVTILARSLQLPMIIAEESGLLSLGGTTRILMDADQGNIYVDPDRDTMGLFEQKDAVRKIAGIKMDRRTKTRDGQKITLMANINLLSELDLARQMNAQGIGLYRTEFPFLIRSTFPSEAEQYIIYKKLIDGAGKMPVTIRTLDAGGEKRLAYSDSPIEANPELGLRSIRFSLHHRDIFENQIRAILRASKGKEQIRVMFPLVSSIDEFLMARKIVADCMEMLDKEGLDYNPGISIGMMIELPSVLETIDEFAGQADFFSIGTNDFVQYMLGADRANKMVSDHYIPHHPAVNRGIAKIVSAAQNHGIDVSVCGEMAHEEDYIPFLIGVGVNTLSVDPQFLPSVQQTIKALDKVHAGKYAKQMLAQTSVEGAGNIMRTWRTKSGFRGL